MKKAEQTDNASSTSDIDFKTSESLTFGVELELQCLNTRDHDMTDAAPDLLNLVKKEKFDGAMVPEITQSMIEINSAVHHRHDTLLANLNQMRDLLVAKAQILNIDIAGGGSHPFQQWSERRIYEGERYQELWNKYGYLAKQFTVFGQHIHIGCTSGDEAVRLLHLMSQHMPDFIALSAASPFYQNQDTQFSSCRLTSINAFPLSGTMPFLTSWDAFADYYNRMKDLRIIASMKDFYWDIRPKPGYGTIEIRVCDTPLTVEKAAALAAYAQTLALKMLHEPNQQPTEDIYLPYRYNRFNAARYGLQGDYINVVTGSKRKLAEVICETIEGLMPYADELGTRAALNLLYQSAYACRNDADELRTIYARTKSFSDVAHAQAQIWASGKLPEAGKK